LPGKATRAGHRGGAARPAHASHRERVAEVTTRPDDAACPPGADQAETPGRARRAREDASIVWVVPLLAVLVVTVAGVYIAWRQGSAGGRDGGVVTGCALLAAAVARLLLPAGLAGLLAVRKRSTDVCTLAAFGIGLLVVGLVLPR
jgi:hypothetical protein